MIEMINHSIPSSLASCEARFNLKVGVSVTCAIAGGDDGLVAFLCPPPHAPRHPADHFSAAPPALSALRRQRVRNSRLSPRQPAGDEARLSTSLNR
ncbi:hypothetical protein EVAR_82534_1 [Eumeta japonica]|uniref:Uncharacterized protein n=1 Tax=Eumeta variegata TaxID=151549 RepID=A0A4C1UXX2_EUMVA|nr:hypothetical protein EVAR_82534_1 [Eumeta japonica]